MNLQGSSHTGQSSLIYRALHSLFSHRQPSTAIAGHQSHPLQLTVDQPVNISFLEDCFFLLLLLLLTTLCRCSAPFSLFKYGPKDYLNSVFPFPVQGAYLCACLPLSRDSPVCTINANAKSHHTSQEERSSGRLTGYCKNHVPSSSLVSGIRSEPPY